MKYSSCRDANARLYTFEEAILNGWADDHGMFVPSDIPVISQETLLEWKSLSYSDLCFEILRLFIDQAEIPSSDLRLIISKALRCFPKENQIVTCTKLQQCHVIELWNGPTLAFKDLGMQILLQLLEYFLAKKKEHLLLLVGTSGDTGSASIEAVRPTSNLDILVLYPKGRISLIQELQMTVPAESAENVAVFGVEGTSDDLDVPIDQVMSDLEFKKEHRLGTSNSINICRILVQTVHYFYAYFQMAQSPNDMISFCVPTGAGGHISGGVIARLMGLTCAQLVLCTNENDIFHRLFTTGIFQVAEEVAQTNSPAMDIQIPYNIERLLYYFSDENGTKVDEWMKILKSERCLKFSAKEIEAMKLKLGIQASFSFTSEQVNQTIKTCFEQCDYILDPHTAVGVSAVHLKKETLKSNLIGCMGCAHPAKFQDILRTALNVSEEEINALLPNQTHPNVTRVLALRNRSPRAPEFRATEDWNLKLRAEIRAMTFKRKSQSKVARSIFN